MKGSLAFDWDGQCNCKIAALNSSNEISLIMDTFKRLLSSILINYLLLPCRPMIYYSILGPLVPNIVPVLSATFAMNQLFVRDGVRKTDVSCSSLLHQWADCPDPGL